MSGENSIYFVTHYYNKKSAPFLSLSELDNEKAIRLMGEMFSNESEFGKRFGNPVEYLRNRRETEKWVRMEFIKKGFMPEEQYPLYFVLGESKWIESQAPSDIIPGKVTIRFDFFSDNDISFTYPDSMVSRWLSNEKPADIYNAKYHGKVFSKDEILALLKEDGNLEETIGKSLPRNIAPYIEAQVWNREKISSVLTEKEFTG